MKKNSFTLIELLFAVSIFSVIIITVYTAFNAGVFAWRRLNTAGNVYRRAAFTLELMAEQISNAIPDRKIGMQGSEHKISFLAFRQEFAGQNLFRESFFLKESSNILIRSWEDIRSILEGGPDGDVIKDEAIIEEFCPDVKNLEFKYFRKRPDVSGNLENKNSYEWAPLLKTQDVCGGVYVCLTLNGPAQIKFRKIIPVYAEN